MKAKLFYSIMLASALAAVNAPAEEKKTLGEKTSETLEKAKDKTVEAGRAVAEGTKKAATAVKDAVTPAEARKVDVSLTEHRIDMAREIPAGKTAFVVRNNGKEKHNFKIEGQGLEKNFLLMIDPNDTKTLDVELKPGNYRVFVPGKDSSYKGSDIDLIVK